MPSYARHQKGDKTETTWGSLTSSRQDVDPAQWIDHARQLMSQYSNGSKESITKLNNLNALVKIWERLSCTVPVVCGKNVKDAVPGILHFEEAFRIYHENIATEASDLKKLHVTFKNQICHKEFGLPVVILSHHQVGKWVILQSANTSMEFILTTLLDKWDLNQESSISGFSYSEVKSLASSDFDRQLIDLVFSHGKSKNQLLGQGINISATIADVEEKIEAIRKVSDEAVEKAKAKLNSEISFVENSIKSNCMKLEAKKQFWPDFALKDLEVEVEIKKERLEKLKEIEVGETEHGRRVLQAKKNIVRDKKLKQVGRSETHTKQGAKRKLTDSDDEYVASMFSEHAGYHGLRNTVTEYVGTVDRHKRIKLEDIKKYYNMRRAEKGEKNIAMSTARRRLAPRRKTSTAAKSHIGKCLISVAVPPRTGESKNENTHYARKFRSNVEESLFSKLKFLPEIRDIDSNSRILFQSKDDAHYVAPGTKEGFDRARQKKIYCPADHEKRFGQPKYDFPDSTLYQTPGSHRILQKISCQNSENDTEEKLARDVNWDFHHVYIRPKITQDSSGVTWASEDVDLIINEPFSLSKEKFTCLRAIQLELKLFSMMQNSEDEKHIGYNLARMKNLYEKVKVQEEQLCCWPEHEELSANVSKLLDMCLKVVQESDSKKAVFSDLGVFSNLMVILKHLLEVLEKLLPPVRPVRVDLVDSGPGQAINQKDVNFCDRLLFKLLDTNYYVRLSEWGWG